MGDDMNEMEGDLMGEVGSAVGTGRALAESGGRARCVTPARCAIWGCSPGTFPSEQPRSFPDPSEQPRSFPDPAGLGGSGVPPRGRGRAPQFEGPVLGP